MVLYQGEGSAQIVKATNGGQNKIRKLAFRSPLVALRCSLVDILRVFIFKFLALILWAMNATILINLSKEAVKIPKSKQ